MTLVNDKWLQNLKEGDLVAIDIGRYTSVHYIVSAVKKVTPTGMIKTSCGRTYNNDGWERGKSSPWQVNTYLQPATEEIKEQIEFRRLINIINDTNFEQMPISKLREVIEVIN
jgi:hypothetical protein